MLLAYGQVGVVSDEKLIELLELAISSNTSETVKRARELLDSGADPLVLMLQLASLIMEIIARNCLVDGANCIDGRSCKLIHFTKISAFIFNHELTISSYFAH